MLIPYNCFSLWIVVLVVTILNSNSDSYSFMLRSAPLASFTRRLISTRSFNNEVSISINKPNTIEILQKYLYDKSIITVGDGDFSFSAYVARTLSPTKLIATTLDHHKIVTTSFVNASQNIAEILKYGYHVDYTINALNLSTSYPNEKVDVVFWNFPHIPSKSNIKYNRQLIRGFLDSAKGLIQVQPRLCENSSLSLGNSYHHHNNPSKDGSIIISLCEGQSGLQATSSMEWTRSWKLLEQVSEAGLMITEVFEYDIQSIDGYKAQGHRGHGGGFRTGKSQIYRIQYPCKAIRSIQSPIYVHEIHFRKEDNLTVALLESSSLSTIQQTIYNYIQSIAKKYGFDKDLWSVLLVDIYQAPTSFTGISFAFQIGYCSLENPISRDTARKYRQIIIDQLPILSGLKIRTGVGRWEISKAYPWFVAMNIRQATSKSYNDHGNDLNRGLSWDINDDDDDNDSTFDTDEKIRLIARNLWNKRAGVIMHESSSSVFE